MNYTKTVVVIGGGFAGINVINQLKNDDRYKIILVDTNNYLFFPPLIYQVATGFMEPSAISYPFRKFLRRKNNVQFRMGTMLGMDTTNNTVILDNGKLHYDILIISTGTETNYFGMEEIAKKTIPMKTISDAVTMRNTILRNLELASRTDDPKERSKHMTIILVGAGPTGVELSGMFAEMRDNVLMKDYPELATFREEIFLIDAASSVLTPMSKESQQYTHAKLTDMGVNILLNAQVKDYRDDTVYLSDGSTLISKNVIWAAGVVAKNFEGLNAEDYSRGRRLIVDEYNKLVNYPNIYALGDTCITFSDPAFPQGHPQMAQPAIQQAINLAKNLRKENNWKPFRYSDKGSMAIIGSNKAVADIPKPKLNIKGFFAWFIWVFIHIMSLVTYKNRVRALYNWVGAYVSKDQSFRLIIEQRRRQEKIIN